MAQNGKFINISITNKKQTTMILLDIIYGMEPNVFFFTLIFSIGLFLLLGYYFTQWFHQLEKRNRYMEAQIRLLSHIALKQDVDIDKISDILSLAEMTPIPAGNAKKDQVRRITLKKDLGAITMEEFEKEKEAIYYQ
jgi:hypothetical protein